MSCGKTIANAIGAIRLNRPAAARPASRARGARAHAHTKITMYPIYTDTTLYRIRRLSRRRWSDTYARDLTFLLVLQGETDTFPQFNVRVSSAGGGAREQESASVDD